MFPEANFNKPESHRWGCLGRALHSYTLHTTTRDTHSSALNDNDNGDDDDASHFAGCESRGGGNNGGGIRTGRAANFVYPSPFKCLESAYTANGEFGKPWMAAETREGEKRGPISLQKSRTLALKRAFLLTWKRKKENLL